MGKKVDLTGQRFGKWAVLSDSGRRMGGFIIWDSQCDCGRIVGVVGTNLRRGLSSSCGKCINIYGIGVNDLEAGNACPFYQTWKRVLERTIAPTRDVVYPSYAGVTVEESWLKLSTFKSWMSSQQWENLEIDKDLLVANSKHYGPDTCWFTPVKINLLLGTSEGKRGDSPIGVCHHNDGPNKYMARCGQKYLGVFPTTKQAHKAWQLQKAKDIVEAVEWWQFTPEVSHSFNQKIAENLFALSDRLVQDASSGNETLRLQI